VTLGTDAPRAKTADGIAWVGSWAKTVALFGIGYHGTRSNPSPSPSSRRGIARAVVQSSESSGKGIGGNGRTVLTMTASRLG